MITVNYQIPAVKSLIFSILKPPYQLKKSSSKVHWVLYEPNLVFVTFLGTNGKSLSSIWFCTVVNWQQHEAKLDLYNILQLMYLLQAQHRTKSNALKSWSKPSAPVVLLKHGRTHWLRVTQIRTAPWKAIFLTDRVTVVNNLKLMKLNEYLFRFMRCNIAKKYLYEAKRCCAPNFWIKHL